MTHRSPPDVVPSIEERVAAIEERNRRVELDKAWETSATRRLLVVILTYAVIGIYLQFVVHISPWVNAVVPSLAFVLSTLALHWARSLWVRRRT